MTGIDAELYERCLEHLDEVRELDFVVRKSLPVPYFGDLAAYLASPDRILTAALNPSDQEFPPDNPRFDVCQGLRGPVELEAQLSAYFAPDRNPYRSWFSALEPVLNGLEASYGGVMAKGKVYASTALHVDMCSPIATNPTWSKLRAEQRATLSKAGREIFERLITEVKPRIIVASLGWGHLKAWNADFAAGRDWERLAEHRTAATTGNLLRPPLLVQVRSISWNGHQFDFVNASAANTPFGRFTNERKCEAGQMLLSRLRSPQREISGP